MNYYFQSLNVGADIVACRKRL